MRSKSIVLLVLALGCGLVASIGISQVMEARNNKPVDQGDRQPVFVALVDISPNELLTAQNIKLEEWPKNLVPPGAITKLEEVEGKRSKIKLYAGETILVNKLLGPNDFIGAANQIPLGYRVIHVKVDAYSGSSNLIRPGDRVDVSVFRSNTADPSATAAKIVLQDVRVFAVDTTTESETRANGATNEPMSAKTISLLVTPAQAEKIHAVQDISGTVRLILRNPDDDAHVASQGVSMEDIFGNESKGDRHREQVTKDKPDPDLTKWIDDQNNQQPPTMPEVPVASGPGRSMILILGDKLTRVDLPGNGQLPQTPQFDDDNSQPSGGNSTTTIIDEIPLDNDATFRTDDNDLGF